MPRPLGWLAGAEWTVIRTEEVSRSVAHPACAVLQHSGAASAKVATDADANLAVATDMLVGGVLLPRFRHEESGRPSAREDGVGFRRISSSERTRATFVHFYEIMGISTMRLITLHSKCSKCMVRDPYRLAPLTGVFSCGRGLITNTVPGRVPGSRCTLPKQCRPAQAPLVARSVTPPSPSGRGGTTLLWQRAPRSCTVFLMTPPNEHTSEGGRDDRGVPYHAESTLSSAQVLKCRPASPSSHWERTRLMSLRLSEV